MAQWDDAMKILVGSDPQTFVSWLLPGAQFLGLLDKELKTRTIYADLLFTTLWGGKEIVLHVEFQSTADSEMSERVWKYNVQTHLLADRPVRSVVIYLVKGGKVAEPVWREVFSDGHVNHTFNYIVIKLWELEAETFQQPGMEGLLPLLPLTRRGKQRVVVQDMVTGLKTNGKDDLLSLGYMIAALALTKEADRKWLKGLFQPMLKDILKDSWAYQELLAEAKAEVRAEAKAEILTEVLAEAKAEILAEVQIEARQQELQTLCLLLNHFVEVHFPTLIPLAKQQVEQVHSPEPLRSLVDALLRARTEEEARQALLQRDTPSL